MKRVLVAFLALTMLFTACGDSGGSDKFPEGFREAYMQGCTQDGNVEFCECTLDELEKNMTAEELAQLATSIDDPSAEPPEKLLEVVLLCIDKIDVGE